MDIIAAEQVVAARLAELTGLELDFAVFRGTFPENLPAALAVAAAAVTVTVESALKSADFTVSGEFSDRDAALTALDRLLTALPDYNCSGVAALLPAGPARLAAGGLDGVVRWTFQLEFTAAGF